MANYIGNEPQSQNGSRDYFSGTGSQTIFTLSYAPGGATGIIVSISGLIQKPSIAYFVSGKTLTFSEAPSVPSVEEANNIEIIYLQKKGVAQTTNWKFPIASNTGTSDALLATYSPTISSLANHTLAMVVLSTPNTTTTPSFSPDGLPAKIIVNNAGTTIGVGALSGTVTLRYDSGLDKWVNI